MELRQLRYFVAIVDHGSLSRAAQVLHVAQPALTQQLRQLEEELGVQLVHRSAQGVLSTDAGKLFYEHAQAILKQVGDARSAVTQSATRPAGSVSLALPHSISGALALPLLLATRERYPEITLQLTEELSGNLTEQLKSGRINLAIQFDDGQLGPFHCTPLVEETMMFLNKTGSVHAPAAGNGGKRPAAGGQARRNRLGLAQALSGPLILPGMQHGVRFRIEKVARAAGLRIDNIIEINSLAILKSALLADMGATILPLAPLLAEVERGDLQATPIDSTDLSRTVTLCASKNIPLTTATAAISQLVQDVTRELCEKGRWLGARPLLN